MSNENNPLISIITCVFNGEKYISRLLDSVLNMGYPNIEHIIVDDGSNDSTSKIVMKYKKLYEEKDGNLYIKYIRQDNKGLGGATNTGLKEVTGQYWTWINCDDWYEKGAFNYLIRVLIRKKTDCVLINHYVTFMKKGLVFKKYKRFDGKTIFRHYLTNNSIKKTTYHHRLIHTHFLVNTSQFDRINPTRTIDPYRYNQDQQFSYTIFLNLSVFFARRPIIFFWYRDDSFYKEQVAIKENGYYDSAIKSFRYLSIDDKEKQSQLAVLALNRECISLLYYYINNNKSSFLSRYYLFFDKIEKKHRKYILFKLRFLNFSINIPFFWTLRFTMRRIKHGLFK